jgi:hypothetical protein
MKKPQVIRKVPSPTNYGSILNTLGVGQIVDLASTLTNYASMREETKQTSIYAQVEIENIDASTKIAMVQQIANSLTSLANTGFEYASEREKTKRVESDAYVRIREINAGLESAEREHKQIMSELKTRQKENKHQFKKDMKSIEISAADLENKDKAIHRILDLLEAGKISEDALIAALNR